MSITPRYPEIRISCDDVVGHALNVVSAVSRSLQKARVPTKEIEAYQNEALSGDYHKALQASLAMVTFYQSIDVTAVVHGLKTEGWRQLSASSVLSYGGDAPASASGANSDDNLNRPGGPYTGVKRGLAHRPQAPAPSKRLRS